MNKVQARPVAAGDREEFVLRRSDHPRMTADEMLADAHDRILAATAKAAEARLAEVTRLVNVLLETAAGMVSAMTEKPVSVFVECPCCGGQFFPGEYVDHVVHPPADWCDRDHWGALSPMTDFIDPAVYKMERVWV